MANIRSPNNDWMTITANFRYTFIYHVGQCHWNQVLMFSQWINLSHRRRSRHPVRFDEHPELPKSGSPRSWQLWARKSAAFGTLKTARVGIQKKIFWNCLSVESGNYWLWASPQFFSTQKSADFFILRYLTLNRSIGYCQAIGVGGGSVQTIGQLCVSAPIFKETIETGPANSNPNGNVRITDTDSVVKH